MMTFTHTPLSDGPDGAKSWCENCCLYCGGTNSDGAAITCNCHKAGEPASQEAPAREEAQDRHPAGSGMGTSASQPGPRLGTAAQENEARRAERGD